MPQLSDFYEKLCQDFNAFGYGKPQVSINLAN